MNKVGTAYILWLSCLVGLAGLHRLYNGKFRTGLLWLCTFGLFGVGQLFDLLVIPKMVDEHNLKLGARQGLLSADAAQLPAIQRVVPTPLSPPAPLSSHPETNQLILKLLHTAAEKGGKLSVTQGVMATGASFTTVEAALLDLVRTGYVDIGNDPETGVVMYEFREL